MEAATTTFPKINPYKPRTASEHLSESYQNMDLKLSFLHAEADGSYTECNLPAKCRDYLHDIIQSNLTGNPFEVYGMKYDPTSNSPVDMDVLRLRLKFPSKKAHESWMTNFWYLAEVEKKNGLEPTRVTMLEPIAQGVQIMVESDKVWMSNAMILSIYSFLNRVLCYEFSTKDIWAELKVKEGNDAGYFKSIKQDVFFKILDDLSLIRFPDFCGWNKDAQIGTVHSSSGFVSILTTNDFSRNYILPNTHYADLKRRGVL